MAKAHRLTNLVFEEVSSVDKGAGEGVRVILAKRDTTEADVDAYMKRDFSADQRQAMADKGQAMKGGGFPIANEADLHNAIMAVGRAKDPEAAKDHIKARAKAMDLESALPDSWISKSTTETTMPMTTEETAALEKQIAASVAKALAPVVDAHKVELAKRDDEIAILKQAPTHRELYKAMSPEEKKKFDAMTQEEKDEKAAETKKAAVSKLDPEIKKALDQAGEDRKILKSLQEKDEVATFAKRAKDAGLPEADGEILRKAYSGDATAQTELDKRLKALTAQVNVGKVFDEFGSGGPGKGDKTAYEEIVEKAVELRKTADGAKLSEAQARVKVMEDPANADLMKRNRTEEVQKRSRAA